MAVVEELVEGAVEGLVEGAAEGSGWSVVVQEGVVAVVVAVSSCFQWPPGVSAVVVPCFSVMPGK